MSLATDIAGYKAGVNADVANQTAANSISPVEVANIGLSLADIFLTYFDAAFDFGTRLSVGNSAPSGGQEGDVYLQFTTNALIKWDKVGSSWSATSTANVGFTLPDQNISLRPAISGLNITVTNGSWIISNMIINKSAQTSLTADAPDATHYRTDLVWADELGDVHYLAGTASSSPVDPTPPTIDSVVVDYLIVPPTGSGDAYFRFYGSQPIGGGSSTFANSFTVNFPDNTSGTPNGYAVTAGDDIGAFLETFLQKAVSPTYVLPTVILSADEATSGHETGESLTINFSTVFIQNDAGGATGTTFKKGGVSIGGSSDSIVLSTTPVNYSATTSYSQGPIKNDSLGNPDPAGRIEAGNVDSNTLSYVGYYKIFFGDRATAPTTSAHVRALGASQLTSAGNTFTLNTGSTNTVFAIWLPNGKSLVSVVDQDALNLDITSEYSGSPMSVDDAGGNSVSGTLYVKTQSVPYSTNHRHNVTIA